MNKTLQITLLSSLVLLISSCSIVKNISDISLIGKDRRSVKSVFQDNLMSFELNSLSEAELKGSHLNFLVFNKKILVTGEVADAELLPYVEELIKTKAPKANKIFNKIRVTPKSSLLARTIDAGISVELNELFYKQDLFYYAHIKILTENRIVYLMGFVTKREADEATKIATGLTTITKVVTIFDYIK